MKSCGFTEYWSANCSNLLPSARPIGASKLRGAELEVRTRSALAGHNIGCSVLATKVMAEDFGREKVTAVSI